MRRLSIFRQPSLIISILLIGAFAASCTQSTQIDHRATPESGGVRSEKPLISAKKAIVVSANPHATDAALTILKQGGSALDGAIAAQMVLNLVEPQSSGIGGGGFLLVFDPETQTLMTYDGRETAPSMASGSLFIKDNGSKMGFFEAAVGGRAVGVPGLVHMLETAHQKHGKLKWPVLFDQAIGLAENGFPVSQRLHNLIKRDRFLKNDPETASYFYDTDGAALPIGHLLKNPALAESLRQIQMGGSLSFYLGKIADDIVDKVQTHKTNPGLLTHLDLQNYKTIVRKPVCLDYRIYKVCGMAPPSSGGLTVLETLGLIEQYDLNNDPKPDIDRTHLLLEASKLAFSDRNQFIADPDFISVPTQQLLSKSYLTGRQTLIQHNQTLATPVPSGGPFLYSGKHAPDTSEHGLSTTHLSVVDENGMVVSMTTSIENAFGSRQMVGGFLLNNQLTDFSFTPEKDGVAIANRIQPNKRPRSSMAPTIVFDKKSNQPVLAIGSPGGSRIIGYVINSLIGILDDGLPLNTALARGHISNRNGASELEIGTEAVEHKAKLETLGHQVKLKEMTSGLHAVQILKNGTLLGAADPRREGVALGY